MAVPASGIPPPPDVNMGPTILGVTSALTLLALITTGLRIFVRSRIIYNLGADDWSMLLAMTLTLALQGVIVPSVVYGAGRHIQYIDPDDAKLGLKLNFVSQGLCLWPIAVVKVSVGFFLLRIAVQQAYRRTIYGIMITYTIPCFFTVIFQCTNPAMLWDSSVQSTCMPPKTLRGLSYLNAALSIFTDLLFSVFLPVPMLWGVQLNFRTKSSIVIILGLGVFACAAALVKMSYLSNYGKTGDFLWDSHNITIWIMCELCIGITAANLPCLKPLVRHILERTGYGSGSRQRGSAFTPRFRSSGSAPERRNFTGPHTDSIDRIYDGKGVERDGSYMMTKISAKTGVDDDGQKSHASNDTLTRLEERRGIVKTVDMEISFVDADADALTAEKLVPEMRVEDRI